MRRSVQSSAEHKNIYTKQSTEDEITEERHPPPAVRTVEAEVAAALGDVFDERRDRVEVDGVVVDGHDVRAGVWRCTGVEPAWAEARSSVPRVASRARDATVAAVLVIAAAAAVGEVVAS